MKKFDGGWLRMAVVVGVGNGSASGVGCAASIPTCPEEP
jgi:hypothetical protein